MFGGIGGSEIIIIAVLFLVIFGPNKLPQMARDIGKFVGDARKSIDEFKNELTVETDTEGPTRRRETPKRANSAGSRGKVEEDSPDDEITEDDTLPENDSPSENGDGKAAKSPEPELRDL